MDRAIKEMYFLAKIWFVSVFGWQAAKEAWKAFFLLHTENWLARPRIAPGSQLTRYTNDNIALYYDISIYILLSKYIIYVYCQKESKTRVHLSEKLISYFSGHLLFVLPCINTAKAIDTHAQHTWDYSIQRCFPIVIIIF